MRHHIPSPDTTEALIQSDPHLGALCRRLSVPQVPLDCREMIPDVTLRRWAAGEPEAARGEITPELQQELAMLLPDLCGELLARRALADAEGGA